MKYRACTMSVTAQRPSVSLTTGLSIELVVKQAQSALCYDACDMKPVVAKYAEVDACVVV